MEKQIDITTEIVNRIDALGYPCKEGSHDYMIVFNLIKANLEKLLGTTVLSEDDCELIRCPHYLVVSSTFTPKPIVFEVNREDESVTLSGLAGIDGEELFNIEKTGNVVVNIFHDKANFIDHEYVVTDYNESTFTYTRYEVEENGKTPVYSASLRALGAKYRDREVFELTRLIPPEYKEQSILKRILDGIKSDSFIQITTSDQTLETIMYTDILFERLEQECNKYMISEPETGKRLQKK